VYFFADLLSVPVRLWHCLLVFFVSIRLQELGCTVTV